MTNQPNNRDESSSNARSSEGGNGQRPRRRRRRRRKSNPSSSAQQNASGGQTQDNTASGTDATAGEDQGSRSGRSRRSRGGRNRRGRSGEKGRHKAPSKPIKTDKGIRARSTSGKFVENWWAVRWTKSLEKILDRNRLQRGQNYARKGQVLTLDITDDGVRARVQGSRKKPYEVKIELTRFDKRTWKKIFDTLSSQALFTAHLLAGKMPEEIEEALQKAKIYLFPRKSAELTTSCTCPDPSNPCKHIAAVHYILAEEFDNNPFLIFRLRGRDTASLLDAIRARRSIETGGDASRKHDDFEEIHQALDTDQYDFWRLGADAQKFQPLIRPPALPQPLLQQLGQPNFLSLDLRDALEPAYNTFTQQAFTVAYTTSIHNKDKDQN